MGLEPRLTLVIVSFVDQNRQVFPLTRSFLHGPNIPLGSSVPAYKLDCLVLIQFDYDQRQFLVIPVSDEIGCLGYTEVSWDLVYLEG